jgi:hypothetical protein
MAMHPLSVHDAVIVEALRTAAAGHRGGMSTSLPPPLERSAFQAARGTKTWSGSTERIASVMACVQHGESP